MLSVYSVLTLSSMVAAAGFATVDVAGDGFDHMIGRRTAELADAAH